jgi:putative PIN family toxin of toxin-antitoxin system
LVQILLGDVDGIAYDTIMKPGIVMDTNVLVSAIRSKRGASHRLLRLVGTDRFEVNLSVPLVFEYEEAGKRTAAELDLPLELVDDIVDYLCAVSAHRKIHFLWRPYLRDVDDDFILELAVESRCDAIVTYNKKDFEGVERFGLRVLTPKEFLEEIGDLP